MPYNATEMPRCPYCRQIHVNHERFRWLGKTQLCSAQDSANSDDIHARNGFALKRSPNRQNKYGIGRAAVEISASTVVPLTRVGVLACY
jgi:hypothetical protein